MEAKVRRIEAGDYGTLSALLGVYDANLAAVTEEFGVKASISGTDILLSGETAENLTRAENALLNMLSFVSAGEEIDKGRAQYCVELAKEGKTAENAEVSAVVAVTSRGKQIKCKTLGQKAYVHAIHHSDVTFGVGPAGTGKTYLAVALAVAAYKDKKIERIVLTRPAVEAGEKLGFLPGDLQEKVDPYLRPLYDALSEMLGEGYLKLMERGVIEVAPLAYMRGRTLNNAFIILDEAQNTTREQMKMFLTRMGEGSKIVVTGDVTQIDLPDGKKSGLLHAVSVLKGVKGVSAITLTAKDVVRHELVMRIIHAYERAEEREEKERKERKVNRLLSSTQPQVAEGEEERTETDN
ncbi:MAG: PhoH family protein [Clostridia bacterium]|nr:PhoH family protein [Clostridia bacterium]